MVDLKNESVSIFHELIDRESRDSLDVRPNEVLKKLSNLWLFAIRDEAIKSGAPAASRQFNVSEEFAQSIADAPLENLMHLSSNGATAFRFHGSEKVAITVLEDPSQGNVLRLLGSRVSPLAD